MAAASVIGDVTAGLLSELVFAAAGFVLLLERRGVESWGGVLACVVVLGCLVACLIAAQVSGIVRPILRRFGGLLRSRMRLALEAGADTLQSELSALYARRGAFAACSGWRTLGWTLGAAEVWLALWFLGHPVSILEALMLESLSQALRTVAFFVPGALGIQEGGFVLLGTAAGLGPEVSLSLMKRARELVLGVPGLVAWQLLEARSLSRGFEGYAPSTKRKVG